MGLGNSVEVQSLLGSMPSRAAQGKESPFALLHPVRFRDCAWKSHCCTSVALSIVSACGYVEGAAAALPNAPATSTRSTILTMPSWLTSSLPSQSWLRCAATCTKSWIFTALSLLTSSRTCGGSMTNPPVAR